MKRINHPDFFAIDVLYYESVKEVLTMNQDISRELHGNPRVQAYLNNMYHWFEKEFSMPRMEFNQRLQQDTSVVIRMFSEEPEIVYHDDPAK